MRPLLTSQLYILQVILPSLCTGGPFCLKCPQPLCLPELLLLLQDPAQTAASLRNLSLPLPLSRCLVSSKSPRRLPKHGSPPGFSNSYPPSKPQWVTDLESFHDSTPHPSSSGPWCLVVTTIWALWNPFECLLVNSLVSLSRGLFYSSVYPQYSMPCLAHTPGIQRLLFKTTDEIN